MSGKEQKHSWITTVNWKILKSILPEKEKPDKRHIRKTLKI
jgi:hypothetical protein